MKNWVFAISLVVLAGCAPGDSAHRDDGHGTPGEQAGRAAYYAQRDAKKAAKELGHELKTFGRDAHEGFQDAKHENQRREVERKRDNAPRDDRDRP